MLERHKAVDTKEFWKDRLDTAVENGNIRHSVFRAPEHMWQDLNKDHLKILNHTIEPTDKVLDAGCGYGRASQFIPVKTEVGGKYVGVDQSSDFINLAKAYDHKNHEFYCEDLKCLPFDHEEFDWCVCISVMIMVVQNLGWSQWEKIQNELLRVSKRGIICLEYGLADTDTTSDTYYIIRKDSR